jgi:tetratricopeptide (TPR) repeat protein
MRREPWEARRVTQARTLLLLLLAVLLACGSREEREQAARARFEEAVANQDASAALEALDDLRAELPDTPETTIETARLLGRLGEVNRALWLLEEAARRHPGRNDLRLGIAETALLVGDPARAREALGGIGEGEPEHAYTLLLRSRAEVGLGDLEAGLATLERAEALYPDHLQLRLERIEVLAREKRVDAALDLLRESRSREDLPEPQRARLDRIEADLLAARGEPDAALRLLEALTAADPGDLEAWDRRTSILMQAGRAEEACGALAGALEARPDEEALYGLLALAERARGNEKGAEAALRERAERSPEPGAVQDLARYLHHAGRTAEGAALLGEAVERFAGETDAEFEYLQVAMLLSAGQLEAARERFEAFERSHPKNPRVEYLRARFELAEGDTAAAARRLTQVVSRFDRPDVHHWLGVALELLGDLEGAEFRYALAVTREPEQLSSYPALLRALERLGAWDRVVYFSNTMLRFAPNSRLAFESLMRALMARGTPDEAEAAIRMYAERFPDLAAPVVALSLALRSQGRPEEALAVLEEASPRFESEPEVLAERAIVLGLLGRVEEGLALLERGFAAGEEHASLHRARAFLLLSSGRGTQGLAEAGRALELDRTDPAPLRMSGDYLSSRGEFAAAAQAYERFLELRPRDAEVLFRLGVARAEVGDAQGAIEAYREAMQMDEAAAAPRNNLALMLEQEGRLDEALTVAQAAYARADFDPQVMDTLGWLYLRTGLVDRAVALLERALSLAPEAADTRYHLAIAYRESGRTGEARELLNELHESLEAGHELHARVGEALASLP